MPLAIRCRGLVKTYPGKPPVEAVRGLDLDFEGLLDPSEPTGLGEPEGVSPRSEPGEPRDGSPPEFREASR